MDEKLKLCMFCGKEIRPEDLTWEHFAPKGLWDKERPQGTRTVPAHRSCNQSYSDDNEYFRDVLVSELGADKHPEVKKILAGTLERKLKKRPGSLAKTFKGLAIREVATSSGLLIGTAPSFSIEWDRLERVLINIMRGVYFITQNAPLPQDWKCSARAVDETLFEEIKNLISRMPPTQTFGDTVFKTRYLCDTKGAFYCLLQFYENRLFLAQSMSRSFYEGWLAHMTGKLALKTSKAP